MEQGWTKSELYVKDLESSAPPLQITEGKEFLYSVQAYNGDLYIVTNEDSPRYRVFKTPATTPAREHWREIIPQTDAVLTSLSVIGGQLFAGYEQNAHSLLKRFDLDGKPLGEIALPTLGTISSIGGEYDSTSAFYLFSSFTTADDDLSVRYPHNRIPQCGSRSRAASMPSSYETKQVWYASKDGTRIPMFLVMRKGLKITGHNPLLLNGYGGFNVSLTPEFSKTLFPWLERGGIFAIANLRGGGEFGEDWHRAGMLDKKQNVFDDFIAAAEYLLERGLHRPRAPGDSRRQQRRPAGGRGDHAAAGPVSRGRLRGAAARHAALPELPDRRSCGFPSTARPTIRSSSSGCTPTRRIST